MGIFFFSSILHGQYRVKTYDISKTITSLKSTDFGHLQYGTSNGELGLYDGIILDRQQNFNASIIDIKYQNNQTFILTSKGLFTTKNNKKTLQSPNNLHVLDYSNDEKMLLTTSGVFEKSGSDFIPNREEFYDINEIKNGRFFEVDKVNILWLDRAVYIKDKSWRELVLHTKSDISVTAQNDKLFISDKKGIVSFGKEGSIDTLYRTDSIGLSKIFGIGEYNLLYCADNQVGIFNIRSRELTHIRELNTELIHATTVDKWNNIWIAAGSYLYQIIDSKNIETFDPPEINISSVKVNGDYHSTKETVALDNGNNDLEISYEGIQLTRPQELVYQTKLTKSNSLSNNVGFNEWSEASKKTEAEYRNLVAGKYRFQVRATVDNKYYTYAETINIRVNDNTVQYYWLAGLLGALGILLTAVFFNSRYNRLKEKSAQERKLLIQENKMLNLQQKALQLQMNPHFVFNALNSIQGLIAREDNKKARKYLQQFSSMMRSVLNQSREEKITLEDEIAYLKSYLSLEQMANNQSFDYEIIEDPNVEDGISIPAMIIQPFIENAIIHGVKGLKERRGKINIYFVQYGENLKCTISDNGLGRKAAAENKISSHKSVALNVVNERLKGKGVRNNPVKYSDKQDEYGNPIGTVVEITLPIS